MSRASRESVLYGPRVRVGYCGFGDAWSPCGRPGSYRATFIDCQSCVGVLLRPEWTGHHCCEEHAAETRKPQISGIDGSPVQLMRLHSVDLTASRS